MREVIHIPLPPINQNQESHDLGYETRPVMQLLNISVPSIIIVVMVMRC